MRYVCLVVGTVVGLSACAGRAGPEGGSGGVADAQVQVTNHNWADMVVYAERGGARVRLGAVNSMQSALLRLPGSLLGGVQSIQLVADPVGSSELHRTAPIQVWPGQTVEYRIENQLTISTASVWDG